MQFHVDRFWLPSSNGRTLNRRGVQFGVGQVRAVGWWVGGSHIRGIVHQNRSSHPDSI